MDLNVKGAKTTRIAEGNYSIPVNAQNVNSQPLKTDLTSKNIFQAAAHRT